MIDDNGLKWLSVSRLIELLESQDGDARIAPNAVGNLLILSQDGSRQIAFIDLLGDGYVELF